jgi:hypothetical protein
MNQLAEYKSILAVIPETLHVYQFASTRIQHQRTTQLLRRYCKQ